MNYQRVLECVSVCFERFPSKLKKFENSLKLPGVLFSISLIIYSRAVSLTKNSTNKNVIEIEREDASHYKITLENRKSNRNFQKKNNKTHNKS